MSKFIIIKADNNDADFIEESVEISDEHITIVRQIIKKLLPYRSTQRWDKGIPYSTQEMERNDSNAEYYISKGILTEEECAVLYQYLPSGDSNYSGIHTISEVNIFEKVETIL